MHELIEYTCFNCNTKFLVFKNIIFNCPTCHTNSFKISKKEFNLNILTGRISYSKTNFLNEIKKIIKQYPFLRDKFLKLKKIKENDIQTLYVPAILYSSKLKTKLDFSNSDKLINKKSKLKFNQVLIDYSKLEQNSLNKIKPFNNYEIDNYEIELENIIIEELDNLINIDSIRNKLIKVYEENEIQKLNKKYQDLKITNSDYNFFDESYQVIYLPVYLYDFNYQDKVYRFLMNPSTGKFTYQIINSKLKIILFLFGILIFTCLLTFCMYMSFESNAFKRWFFYLITFDTIILIWLFKKLKTEKTIINKQNYIYEIIEEVVGD